MQATTLAAPARARIGVKGGEKRRQVLDDVGDGDLDALDERAAFEAEPFEAVLVAQPARAFDDEPDGALDRALWRVAQMRRHQKDLVFPDRHVIDPTRFGELQDHVAAQLVKEFLTWIVVEVDSLVRAAHNHHDHTGVFEYQFVATGGFSRWQCASIHRAKLNGLRKLATVIALLLPVDTVLLSRQLALPKPQANARRSRISPFAATAPDRDRHSAPGVSGCQPGAILMRGELATNTK
jgi:hypothetical protein